MERSWLETIQLLGLDVVLGVVLVALVTDWAYGALDRLWGALRRVRRARTLPEPETSHSPWPPQEWRPSH